MIRRPPRSPLFPYPPLSRSARPGLAALLAGRAVLLEPDRAVHPHEADPPEGVADRLGLVSAGDADRLGDRGDAVVTAEPRSEEHTSELQSQSNLVCRLLLEK